MKGTYGTIQTMDATAYKIIVLHPKAVKLGDSIYLCLQSYYYKIGEVQSANKQGEVFLNFGGAPTEILRISHRLNQILDRRNISKVEITTFFQNLLPNKLVYVTKL